MTLRFVTLFLVFYFIVSVVSKETLKLIAVGGLTGNDYTSLSDVEIFNPYNSDNSCPKLPDFPIPISRHFGAVTSPGNYMVCGGVDDTLVQQRKCYLGDMNHSFSMND